MRNKDRMRKKKKMMMMMTTSKERCTLLQDQASGAEREGLARLWQRLPLQIKKDAPGTPAWTEEDGEEEEEEEEDIVE
jgi:hypothetical protein